MQHCILYVAEDSCFVTLYSTGPLALKKKTWTVDLNSYNCRFYSDS